MKVGDEMIVDIDRDDRAALIEIGEIVYGKGERPSNHASIREVGRLKTGMSDAYEDLREIWNVLGVNTTREAIEQLKAKMTRLGELERERSFRLEKLESVHIKELEQQLEVKDDCIGKLEAHMDDIARELKLVGWKLLHPRG